MPLVSSPQTAVSGFSDVPPKASITPLPENIIQGSENLSSEDTPLTSRTLSVTPPKNRYFIMKSLTIEDLVWSVNQKVWATQPHNESALNVAFKVYLFVEIGSNL